MNLSQQRREESIRKIGEIRTFIAQAQQDENTGRLLTYLSELEKDVRAKKYGLVFEEHREKIDDILDNNLPVLTDQPDLFLDHGGQMNFLLEGDNLAALQLLLKTHRGKIDLIYIDPPYNTGNKDFIYNDDYIDKNDGFRHSKWISFMEKRLKVAKSLLSENGCIFISIDDNESASLKLLCDEVLGEICFIGNIAWESKTKSQNTKTAFNKLQPKVEHIFVFAKNPKKKFNLRIVDTKKYEEVDDKGPFRYAKIEIMSSESVRGRESMVFPILGVNPPPLHQWQLGNDTINFYQERGDVILKKGIPTLKMRPGDERMDITEPFWGFLSKELGTAESAKKELTAIFESKGHGFETVKPVSLINRLLFHASNPNSTILDFFAGSGTTGHAVLKLNAEDGGTRRFILCTNNENGICRDITYERIKRVIDKENYSASLKYYKIEYVPISERLYYEYADELLRHVRELVELENGVNFQNNSEVAIVLTDEELENFVENRDALRACKNLYLGHDVLLNRKQGSAIKRHRIKVNVIPQYYFEES